MGFDGRQPGDNPPLEIIEALRKELEDYKHCAKTWGLAAEKLHAERDRLLTERDELLKNREGWSEAIVEAAAVRNERDALRAELATERHSTAVSDQVCVAEMSARKKAEADCNALRLENAELRELLREVQKTIEATPSYYERAKLYARIAAALKS